MQIAVGTSLLQPELITLIALVAVIGDALLPVLPSGSLVIAASLLSYGHGVAPFVLVLAVGVASFLGDLALLAVVRSGSGRTFARLTRHARAASAAQRLQSALGAQMGRAAVAARFVPAGRTVLGVMIGTTPAQHAAYLRWSAVGGLMWAGYLVGLGCLNNLWLETRWIGFAVSATAAVIISTLLARAAHRSGFPGAGPGAEPGHSSLDVRNTPSVVSVSMLSASSFNATGPERSVPRAMERCAPASSLCHSSGLAASTRDSTCRRQPSASRRISRSVTPPRDHRTKVSRSVRTVRRERDEEKVAGWVKDTWPQVEAPRRRSGPSSSLRTRPDSRWTQSRFP